MLEFWKAMYKNNELIVLTNSENICLKNTNDCFIDKCFLSNMNALVSRWPTQVTVLVSTNSSCSPLNKAAISLQDLSFHTEFVSDFGSRDMCGRLLSAGLVVCDTPNIINIHHRLSKLKIPNVAVIKHTSSHSRLNNIQNLLKLRFKSDLDDVKFAHAIQASGLQVYRTALAVNSNSFLFHDSCTKQSQLATQQEQQARHDRINNHQEPLRIGFVGPLTHDNGAHLVPKLVKHLSDLFVPFTFHVFGTNQRSLKKECMFLKNIVFHDVDSFSNQFIDKARSEIDLMVMPTLQSSSMASYLRVLGCGIPIVGFNSQDWNSLLSISPVGWSECSNDIQALADRIKRISEQRDDWAAKSIIAAEFAADHTIEKEYDRRVKHLQHVLSTAVFR